MRLNFNKENYGRLVLIGTALLMWLLIIVLFKYYGYQETWQLWNVPTALPPFLDFRIIPGSAESFLRGYEPTVENPYDPDARIFNYPMFWRIFFYSGVTQADSIWISILMIVLFFIAVFLFPEKLTIPGALAMLLVIFSPASMLLYERGNVDLIVFFICVMAVLAESYSGLAATALLMFGIVVKVYPFFGISVLLKENKTRFSLLVAGCLAVLVSYVYIAIESMRVSWNLTPRGEHISYGTNIFFLRYQQNIFQDMGQNIALLKFGPMVLGMILILIVALAGIMDRESPQISSERNLAAFRMGASIYVGTFLLGNNWDYRLAFLILIVPQLMQWTGSTRKKYRFVATISMFTLLASCWHFVPWYSPLLNLSVDLREFVFIFDELMNWILMASLAYLLVVSTPEWLKSFFWHLFPKRIAAHPVR